MVDRQRQHGDHLPAVLALPHQRGVTAAAQRKAERVEEDGLAGAGLAGQCRQARIEADIQLVDEDDISDR
jgi:hypothetical protein